jgi:hypothetical protein
MLCPAVSAAVVLSRVTPVTGTGMTVTTQLPLNEPSVVVAVMVAEPSERAVTSPVDDTLAFALLLDQVTALFVAFAGLIVAVSCSVKPRPIDAAALFNAMLVT